MRILILSQFFPPDMGGGATRAYNIARGLVLNGCETIVVTAFPHYPYGKIPKKYRWKPLTIEYMDGFKVIRTFMLPVSSQGLGKRILIFAVFTVSSLFALPLVGKIDVIWTANPNIISIFPSIIYAIVKRCPIVQNVDDLWPEELYELGMLSEKSPLAKFAELLAKFSYKISKAITPISPGYVKVICGKYSINPNKVYVIRAGVDINKFKACDSVNKCEKTFKVLYSGAFSVAYDFDQVLLVARLLEDVKDIEFILQGGGELAPYLKAKVKELKLENVKIVDKILSRDDVAKLLSEATALILPLRNFGRPYLGISSKLYEYQAVGKPVICCAEGQPAEYVKETGSGVVVKPGDYEALAKAVLYLKNNPDLAKKLGKNGRKYVKKEASIEAVGLGMKKIFELICDRQR
jgi:glycosyltransferase involved in cell wall biosynthesis